MIPKKKTLQRKNGWEGFEEVKGNNLILNQQIQKGQSSKLPMIGKNTKDNKILDLTNTGENWFISEDSMIKTEGKQTFLIC